MSWLWVLGGLRFGFLDIRSSMWDLGSEFLELGSWFWIVLVSGLMVPIAYCWLND